MGFLAWLTGEQPLAAESLEGPAFEVGTQSIDPAFFGIPTYSDPINPVGRISRESAIQVPAVKRARDLICGTLGGVPMELIAPGFDLTSSALLEQPERNIPRSVTYTRLFEDLLFEGVAWWKVRENDYRQYPTKVERVAPHRVEVRTDGGTFIDGKKVTNPAASLIQFSSPNDPLLVSGARAIRTLLRLEAAAATYAEDPMPQGYFAPADDADPLEDDEIALMLSAWAAQRRKRATAYVPAAMKYNTVSFSPEQLQMGEARQHAVLEIARLTGISAEDLSVSTTSRTYFNSQDARLQRIADVLGPYSLAVTDRLRMNDITARGYSVRADFSAFLRADDKTRLENYQLAVALGILTVEDVAAREGLPNSERVESPPALTVVPEERTA